MNHRGEPLDRESRRGRRDLGPKNPVGPTAMFLKQDSHLWPYFQPRPPLKFVGTITKKKCLPLTGITEFVEQFKSGPAPERVYQETTRQKHERLRKEKEEAHKEALKPKVEAYRAKQEKLSALKRKTADGAGDATSAAKASAEVAAGQNGKEAKEGESNASEAAEAGDSSSSSSENTGSAGAGAGAPDANYTTNPFCTLFAARLPFDITESRLRRVFSKWGPITKVHLLTHRDGSPRGMAFIEYEEEAHMRAAYDRADGMKLGRNLDGKDIRILVDVERGRTVRDWLPRRLGGGLGGTRRGSVRVNDRSSGRAGAERERLNLTGGGGGSSSYNRGSPRRPPVRDFSRGPAWDRGRRDFDRGRDRDRDRDRDRRGRSRDRRSGRDRDRDRRSYREDDRKRSRH